MRLLDCFVQIFAYTSYLLESTSRVQPDYAAVRRDYDRLLAQSREDAAGMGFSQEQYQDGFFPVCAWTDEAILSSSWEGRESWLGNELQRIHFDTNNGGEQFFTYMRSLRPDQKETSWIYAMCLALGFRGCHYSEEDTPALSDMLAKEIGKLAPEDAVTCVVETECPLFPSSYPPEAVPARRRKRFRRLGAFNLLYASLLAAPLIAFGVFYFSCDTGLNQMVQNLLSTLYPK